MRLLITIPRKNHRKAFSRNLLKRRIREAYRRHKEILCEPHLRNHTSIHAALVFTAREMASYKEIEEKIILILHRLVRESCKD